MVILIILIPMSVVLALLAAGMFLYMNRQGQFDDLESPAFSVIADDDSVHADQHDPPVA
ncbi:MAG: cbb3-type cytochrome oxidase assembly protein CcoS [Pseudomonadota bacterium]|nr:cbb3-type cytochrome oxidase assembly protein CcoS [Pseudomonadota bacterium]